MRLEIQAVAFDLDDTLLRDDRSISDYTVSVLNRLAAKGIRILPASGRARDSMAGFVDRIGCADVFIACNGAEIWRTDGTLLMQSCLTQEAVQLALALGEEYGVYMHTYDGSCFYYNRDCRYARDYAESSLLTGHLCPDLASFVRTHPTSKILMMDEPGKIARMRTDARSRFPATMSITTSKPYFLEVNPAGTSKGTALGECASLLGFSLKNTLAFGDSLNDLSMLTCSGWSCAVANAWDEVLAACTFRTLSNEQDGVAHFLDTHLLSDPSPLSARSVNLRD